MNENFLQYWQRVKQYWNQFGQVQRIMFIATVLFLILTISLVSYNLSKTEYALAYTDLQPSDAAAIVTYLDSAKIPYQLSADGKSIGVPKKHVAEVKIAVESQGLNKNGNLGYGAFKQSGFGMTDNEFKVKHIEAIQGELQQLIAANNAVGSSKVVINLPEQSVFLRDKSDNLASASVVVHLKPGYIFDQGKIDTIFHLVSHSLPNLPIENITISDQNGDPLVYSKSSNTSLSNATLASQQFQINSQFQRDIERNVQQMLGKIFGVEKVIVSVFSTMNFDQRKSHESLVSPVNTMDQRGIEISLQELSKSYSSDSGIPDGGVPGTGEEDIPGYPGVTNSGRTNSEEVQRIANYEVNRITNDIESAPYVVKDLTINVGIEPPVSHDPGSLTDDIRIQVQTILVNVVRAALADSGQSLADEELNKKVAVFAHSFATTSVVENNMNTYWYYGALGLAAVGLSAMGVYAVRNRNRRRFIEEQELDSSFQPKVEIPSIEDTHHTSENQMRKQLEGLAKREPEEFVNLLRTWLVDE